MNWYKKSQWGSFGVMIKDPDTDSKVRDLENISRTNEGKEIDGFFVDQDIAKGILSLYRKLSTEGKERFLKLPIPEMLDKVIEYNRSKD